MKSESSMTESSSPREIPGNLGLPLIGPLKDRLDFFWFQGEDGFFRSRRDKYKSTVFRVNFVPTPPVFPDSRGVALLDQASYGILYDNSKVEKQDVFVGSFLPKAAFTGGYRTLAYIDPADDKHTLLKGFLFELIEANRTRTFSEFAKAFAETFDGVEKQTGQGKAVDFYNSSLKFAMDFLIRTFVHRDPSAPGHASLGDHAPSLFNAWIGVQFAGIAQSGLPHVIEEIALHSVPLPFALVKSNYEKIYKFFKTYANDAIALATDKFSLDREEAIHNLIFILGVNAWLGLIRLFPSILYYVAKEGGGELQAKLRAEVKASSSGEITPEAIAEMPLVRSTVLEVLRLSSPAKYQYARAKSDLIVESHDAAFAVKKGELLGGCLRFASRDKAVFDAPDTFIAERFLGEEGRKLFPHLLWSNGYEDQPTTTTNKQCGGKDLVELVSCLLLAEIFSRYDSFQIAKNSSIEVFPPKVNIISLQKAS